MLTLSLTLTLPLTLALPLTLSRQLYASLLATAAASRTEKKAPKKPSASTRQATPAQTLRLSQTVARNLFFDLRKAANHPLLLRRHYTEATLLVI